MDNLTVNDLIRAKKLLENNTAEIKSEPILLHPQLYILAEKKGWDMSPYQVYQEIPTHG